jgi:ribonuclease T2
LPKLRPHRAGSADVEVCQARARKRTGTLRFAFFINLCAVAPALAQSTPPQIVAARPAPGNFDFFVLSLSWSPGFCATAAGDKASDQCATGAGLGFVVHGLWPQFEHGFPSDCDGTRTPSRIALQHAAGLYPDEGLARYEWRKHGTCTGEAPADYFADVRRARDAITVPATFQGPSTAQTIAPAAVAQAFREANPRLRPGMMAIICQKTILQEVRVCLTKNLRDFRTCPEVVRASCQSSEISVPPIR